MTANRSWIKFWPQDWQRDPALRSCGAAARGIWMDLLCIAHEGTPYGHVTINGRAVTLRQIGTITGVGEKEAIRLVQELEDAGVFSRDHEGTIYSRRMVRDKEASEVGRKHIQKRWEKGSDPNGEDISAPMTEPITPLVGGVIHQEERSKKKDSSLREGVEPTPPDAKTALWREGLAILVRLSGKPEGPTRKLLGKLVDAAHADHERLLGLLRRAESEQPSDPMAWLTAGAKGGNGREPDLLDPWGINAWVATEPTELGTIDDVKVPCIAGFGAEGLATMIAEAAGLPPTWRGSWAPLGSWLRDGIDSDTILAGIKRRAEWSEYTPPSSLAYFEKPVREAAMRTNGRSR